jgi:hypothetical protein
MDHRGCARIARWRGVFRDQIFGNFIGPEASGQQWAGTQESAEPTATPADFRIIGIGIVVTIPCLTAAIQAQPAEQTVGATVLSAGQLFGIDFGRVHLGPFAHLGEGVGPGLFGPRQFGHGFSGVRDTSAQPGPEPLQPVTQTFGAFSISFACARTFVATVTSALGADASACAFGAIARARAFVSTDTGALGAEASARTLGAIARAFVSTVTGTLGADSSARTLGSVTSARAFVSTITGALGTDSSACAFGAIARACAFVSTVTSALGAEASARTLGAIGFTLVSGQASLNHLRGGFWTGDGFHVGQGLVHSGGACLGAGIRVGTSGHYGSVLEATP